MRVKTGHVEYSRKFNLGNYESVEITCSSWFDIDEDEDERGCMMLAIDTCKDVVKNNVPPNYKPINLTTKHMIAGIEVED